MGFVDSAMILARFIVFLMLLQKVTSQCSLLPGPFECKNGGTCNATMSYCECSPEYAGPFCETERCTDSMGCMNGGTCVIGTSPALNECMCADGFEGDNCEYEITPTGTDSDDVACGGRNDGYCLNEGICETLVLDNTRFKCRCPADYHGPTCELFGVCSESNRCWNEGNCSDEECQCAAGFSGILCERACESNDQCFNLGTCDVPKGECICTSDYTGPKCGIGPAFCERDADCLHGGTCDGVGDCTCINDYEGQYCEIVCFQNQQCLNGGNCRPDGTCNCSGGATGARCQMLPADSTGVFIAVAVVVVVLILVVVILLVVLLMKHRSKKRNQSHDGHIEMASTSRPNDYIGIGGDRRSVGSTGPLLNASNYEPNGKEFPRELLHIMGQLGAGSFATVHKAEADGIRKKGVMTTVAVKMLKTTATETDKSDFNKERNMYLNLGSHPNVVTMLGFCTEQEPFFLIMEYLPNGNLQSYLRHIRTRSKEQYGNLKEEKKRNFLLPDEILSFANMIANGMEFLSSKMCIHRDLATRNILLGEDLVAKVSDFGLARDIQDERQYEMKSKGRVPVRWMAPESLLDNVYTPKSDVWGYAVLMWELVTLGSHPYPGMSSLEVIEKVKVGYRLPKPEHCSDEIYDLMKQCWNGNPDERPTFTEICTQLHCMMADANGYLIMSDLNKDDYLYLEPNQTTVNTADDF